jgi:hypothetical protein
MAEILNPDVLAVLGIPEIPVNSFFILKSETGNLIGFVTPELGSRWVIMRDPDLAARCRSYLEQYGTRTFRSIKELADAARLENWPHWEQHFPPQSVKDQ